MDLLLVFVLLSGAASLIGSMMLTGKADPWMIVRGVVKFLRRGMSHIFRSLSKGLRSLSRDSWRQAKRPGTVFLGRLLLGLAAAVLAITAAALSIPPALLGGGGKKK